MDQSINEREKESARVGLLAALLGGLFIFDIITPLGFANHFLYATCILVASASTIPWLPWATAGTASALTIIGTFFSQPWPGLPLWIPIANRVFTISVLCVLAWFAVKRRQAETALMKVNERLEEKVSDRTKELAGVNQALVSEITERMEAEQALRISQGRLAGILNIAEDAIIVIDDSRSVVLFNRGAVKLFGYEAEDVLGCSLDRLLSEGHRADHPAFAAAQDPNHLPHRLDLFGRRKDGTEFPAEVTISPLTVGHKTTFTIILRDTTDRLRTERQLQSLTTQLMTAQEEERRRISRELHDDINQRLALLAIELGRLEAHPPATPDKARSAFQALTQRLAAISDDVRRMAYQFHPSILDDLGLSAALQYLADDFSAKTGIKTIVVQEELDEPLPRHIASCLYRITQESLANVTKHAKTSRVELELTCDEQAVTLSIHDAGVGFDVERVQAQHAGLGLVNMRERVRSVRGRLDIHSQPGEGTHIIVNIPLPGAPHESSTSPLSR